MDEQVKQPQQFTEAPASWNIKYRVKGFDEMITLRGNSYADIAPQADKAREWVHKNTAPGASSTFDAINVEDSVSGLPAVEPAIQVEPKVQPSGATESFEAEELTVSVTDGATYTKVKGGQFKKFGVTIWPEVLTEAGIGKLDPAKSPYSLRGYMAFFSRKEDGKPGKVVKLAKATA